MDSQLQIGLIVLGMLAVVGIFAYNKWQEGRYRREAEKSFRPSDTRDVLLDDAHNARVHRIEPGEASTPAATEGGRAEPSEQAATGGADEVQRKPGKARRRAKVGEVQKVPELGRPESSASDTMRARTRRNAPPVPEWVASPIIDCAIRTEAFEALEGARLWPMQLEQMQGVTRPVRWFAFDDSRNDWIVLNAQTESKHNWFCAVLQLVDRQGAVTEDEFANFAGGVQCVAEQFNGMPADMLSRASILSRANDIDRFCAGVDVQVGVNVLANAAPFNGIKIRTLAESSGMHLEEDGRYHTKDENGVTLYSLACSEPGVRFDPASLQRLQVGGLTLLLDVPLAPNGAEAFDRMMKLANLVAHSLGGNVVDDNRIHFGAEAAALIRSQIVQFQEKMNAAGIPPGGELAKRLFSVQTRPATAAAAPAA